MFPNMFLFLKAAIFFFGISIAIAYSVHRCVFLLNRAKLYKQFPAAFDSCFSLISDFYDIIEGASSTDIDRFLVQVVNRKNLDLARTFHDLPSKVVRGAYHELIKAREEHISQPKTVIERIRQNIFDQYLQSYTQTILYDSLNWLLIIIPIAFTTGLLLPLLFIIYVPQILQHWPILLSWSGLVLGVVTTYMTVRDYYLRG
jgi:hypothetical protein